jgi:hypothetical protein
MRKTMEPLEAVLQRPDFAPFFRCFLSFSPAAHFIYIKYIYTKKDAGSIT